MSEESERAAKRKRESETVRHDTPTTGAPRFSDVVEPEDAPGPTTTTGAAEQHEAPEGPEHQEGPTGEQGEYHPDAVAAAEGRYGERDTAADDNETKRS